MAPSQKTTLGKGHHTTTEKTVTQSQSMHAGKERSNEGIRRSSSNSKEEVTQEQDGDKVPALADIDEMGIPDVAHHTSLMTPGVTAAGERVDAQKSVAPEYHLEKQQDVETLDGGLVEEYIMMDDGTSDLSPGDPITSKRTLDFVHDLLTPEQTLPMEISYETIAHAWDSRAVQQQPDMPPSTHSPELQSVFDEWLVPEQPEQASE